MPLRLIPAGTKINFMRWRHVALIGSSIVNLIAIVAVVVIGLNFGIDFRGGILMEIATQGPADLAKLRNTMSGLGLGEVELQEFGAANNVLIRIERQGDDERAQQAAVDKVKAALGQGIEYRRTEVVGPKVGDELIRAGAIATVLAMAAIAIYVWFRFQFLFGVAALVSLLHDVLTTLGLFALLGLEFNLTTVAALLTVAGYSVNDTVVVFDRVRENMRKYKSMPLIDLHNLSVNETLSRTLLTSGTTFVAVLMLFLFGGEVIHGFSLAMLWGIFVGTYSSVYVASAMLLYLGVHIGLPGHRGEATTEISRP